MEPLVLYHFVSLIYKPSFYVKIDVVKLDISSEKMELLAEDWQIQGDGNSVNESPMPVAEFKYQPLASTSWIQEEGGGYCYLCAVAKEAPGKNPAREEIESKLAELAEKIDPETLCELISNLHFNRVVKKVFPPAIQETYRWTPSTVFKHVTAHTVDARFMILQSIWSLNDYDAIYKRLGRKFETQSGQEVLPTPSHIRTHAYILQQRVDLLHALKRLSSKSNR
jgi:hypothetical protein